jgi:hypothetical protein
MSGRELKREIQGAGWCKLMSVETTKAPPDAWGWRGAEVVLFVTLHLLLTLLCSGPCPGRSSSQIALWLPLALANEKLCLVLANEKLHLGLAQETFWVWPMGRLVSECLCLSSQIHMLKS